jgi:hypothetical protein
MDQEQTPARGASLEGRSPKMGTRSDRSGTRAAQAALLVLRAAVPESAEISPGRIIVRPGRSMHRQEEVVDFLAGLPKPVQCRAAIEGSTLAVECEPLSAGNQFLQGDEASLLPDEEDGVQLSAADGILLQGRAEEALLVDREALQQFMRDYVVLNGYLATADVPEPDEVGTGAKWVVRFGSVPTEIHRFRSSGPEAH